jgi:hypothetical protein
MISDLIEYIVCFDNGRALIMGDNVGKLISIFSGNQGSPNPSSSYSVITPLLLRYKPLGKVEPNIPFQGTIFANKNFSYLNVWILFRYNLWKGGVRGTLVP